MHRLSVTRVGSTLAVLLLISVGALCAETRFGVPFDLGKPVHLVTIDGEPVLLDAGRYSLERAELNLRIVPAGGGDGSVVKARLLPHDLRIAGPIALSTPGQGEFTDAHFVTLLMPGGESLNAVGSYSGVMRRGWNPWEEVKKITRKVVSDTKKTVENVDKATQQIVKDIDKGTQQLITDTQKGSEQFAKDMEKGLNDAGQWIGETYTELERQTNDVLNDARKGLEDRMRQYERCFSSNVFAGDTAACTEVVVQIGEDTMAAFNAALDAVRHMIPGADEFLQQLLCEAMVAVMQGAEWVNYLTGPIDQAIQQMLRPVTSAANSMIEPHAEQIAALLEPDALVQAMAPYASELERLTPIIDEIETMQRRSGPLRDLLLSPQVCRLSSDELDRRIQGILGPSLDRIMRGGTRPVRTPVVKQPAIPGRDVSRERTEVTPDRAQPDRAQPDRVQRTPVTRPATFSVPPDAGPVDSDFYYQITNLLLENGRPQSLEARSGNETDLFMGPSNPESAGQMWKLNPLGDGLYRLTNALLGDDQSLMTRTLKESWRAGELGRTLFMERPGDHRRQQWKFVPQDGGAYMLTTAGDRWRSLAGSSSITSIPHMGLGNAGSAPEQSWALIRLSKVADSPQRRGAVTQVVAMTPDETAPNPRWRPLLQPIARGAGDVDQAWTPSTRTGESIRAGATSAQTFTVAKAGLLTKLALRINRQAWADDDLILSIRRVGDDGRPSQKELFTKALAPSEFPIVFSEELTEIDVTPGGIMVQPGDRLAVTVTNPGGVDYEWWYSAGYKGGQGYVQQSDEWVGREGDFVFLSEVDAEGFAVATRDGRAAPPKCCSLWLGVKGDVTFAWQNDIQVVKLQGGVGRYFPGTRHPFFGGTFAFNMAGKLIKGKDSPKGHVVAPMVQARVHWRPGPGKEHGGAFVISVPARNFAQVWRSLRKQVDEDPLAGLSRLPSPFASDGISANTKVHSPDPGEESPDGESEKKGFGGRKISYSMWTSSSAPGNTDSYP